MAYKGTTHAISAVDKLLVMLCDENGGMLALIPIENTPSITVWMELC